jgi:hypothetical protein
VAFVTLCEAYMTIELHFNLRNYFFAPGFYRARVQKQLFWVVWTSM